MKKKTAEKKKTVLTHTTKNCVAQQLYNVYATTNNTIIDDWRFCSAISRRMVLDEKKKNVMKKKRAKKWNRAKEK